MVLPGQFRSLHLNSTSPPPPRERPSSAIAISPLPLYFSFRDSLPSANPPFPTPDMHLPFLKYWVLLFSKLAVLHQFAASYRQSSAISQEAKASFPLNSPAFVSPLRGCYPRFAASSPPWSLVPNFATPYRSALFSIPCQPVLQKTFFTKSLIPFLNPGLPRRYFPP